MDIRAILIYCVIILAALLIPWSEGLLKKNKHLLIAVIALGLAFALRALYFEFRSGDYNTFLVNWVEYYRSGGGFAALKDSLGNYNLPYLYFLALFSYIDINDLYLIKLLSIAFDLVLAFGMMKLAGLFTRSVPRRLAAYLITLLLPTVIINGAKWGQCDSIYVAFAVLAVWAALSSKPIRSMVFLALSFGFKLQAVFIMPLFLVFWFARRIKFWHFFIFPATYLVQILPAIIAGRPFKDAFLLYYNQAGTVGSGLNYNSPSVFTLAPENAAAAPLSAVGIVAAFLFVGLILLWAWMRRKNLTNEALLFIGLLFAVGIPFLLPHMHDRYFYMADVLTLLPAVLYAGFVPLPILASFASILCYYSYFNQEYLLPLQYGTAALIAVLFILLVQTAVRLSSRRFGSIEKYT